VRNGGTDSVRGSEVGEERVTGSLLLGDVGFVW